MYLIRLLVLSGLIHNRRVYAHYMKSADNGPADSLSRLDFNCFYTIMQGMNPNPENLPQEIWPVSKIWKD